MQGPAGSKTKTKTKTDFWSQSGLVLRPTDSDHITADLAAESTLSLPGIYMARHCQVYIWHMARNPAHQSISAV